MEDLAEDLVCHVTTVRAPPIIHSVRPTEHFNTLKLRDDGLFKVCYVCKLLGLKGETSKTMCAICKVPVHIECLLIQRRECCNFDNLLWSPTAICFLIIHHLHRRITIPFPSFLMRPQKIFVRVPSP